MRSKRGEMLGRYGHDTEPYIHAIRYREVSLSQETDKRVLSKCLLFRRLSLFQNIEPVLDHLNIHGKVEKHEFISRADGFFSGALIIQMNSTEEVDKILDLHARNVLQNQARLFMSTFLERYKGMGFHQDLKVVGNFKLKVTVGKTKGVTPKDFVLCVEGLFLEYNCTRIVPFLTAKGKLTGHALLAFASIAEYEKARKKAVDDWGLKVENMTGCENTSNNLSKIMEELRFF